MKFEYLNAPTIQERVALGSGQPTTNEDAIVPFARDWKPENLTSSLKPGSYGNIITLLNGGYEVGRLDCYTDEEGRRISAALRLDHPTERKQVFPLRATSSLVNPRLEAKAIRPPRPLFNLHLLAERLSAPVLLVEGEKAATAAASRLPSHVASTWSGGTPGWSKADWRSLIGRDVTIWPDNDEPGIGAAEKIGALLRDIGAASVRVVQIPDTFPAKWDLADPLPERIGG